MRPSMPRWERRLPIDCAVADTLPNKDARICESQDERKRDGESEQYLEIPNFFRIVCAIQINKPYREWLGDRREPA